MPSTGGPQVKGATNYVKPKEVRDAKFYCDPDNRYEFINDFMFDLHRGATPPNNTFSTWIWPKQEEIIDSVYKNKNTVVVSANGVGKTFIASVISAMWLVTEPDTIIITTAPTWMQVEKLLWGEIRSRFNTSKKPLVSVAVNQTSIKIDDKWYAIGLSTDQEERFQGFHGKRVLVIIDEASGVDRRIWKAISGIVNSDEAKLLVIGNPNTKDCRFFEVSQLSNYNTITITAFDHPNVMAGKFLYEKYADKWDTFNEEQRLKLMQPANIIPGAVTFLGVQAIADDYGKDSQVYQVRVNAQFPSEEDDVLIPYSDIIRHIRTEKDEKPKHAPIGALDVARMGDCETVLTWRYGAWVDDQQIWKKKDLEETSDLVVVYAQSRTMYEYINIDADGMGSGLYDNLYKRNRARVREFHGGLPAKSVTTIVDTDTKKGGQLSKFVNRRSELYWALRMKFIDKNRETILIPNDPILIAQLNSLKFYLNAKGQIQVESKDSLMGRGIKSPDRADSLMMSEDISGENNLDNYSAGGSVEMYDDFSVEDSNEEGPYEEENDSPFTDLVSNTVEQGWF